MVRPFFATYIANNSADALHESSVNELQVEDYGLLDHPSSILMILYLWDTLNENVREKFALRITSRKY